LFWQANALLWGCTHAPAQRFNLESVKVTGNSQLDDDEIEERIASRETPKFLGLFPGVVYDYEVFNRFVLERDLQRVERFYRSRGYYQAHARAAHVFRSGSKVRVEIVVEEGPAVLLRRVDLHGIEALPPAVQAEARASVTRELPLNAPFEEDKLAAASKALARTLGDRGYAQAVVRKSADVSLPQGSAAAGFFVDAGQPSEFGDVKLEGLADLPEDRVRRALDIKPGTPYSQSGLDQSKRAVLDLGVFSSVELEPQLAAATPGPSGKLRVPILVKLEKAKLRSVRLGGGVLIDALKSDVHLTLGWENQSFLGGMRKLELELMPGAVVYPTRFPSFKTPERLLPQGRFRTEFRQPGFLTGRTNLLLKGQVAAYPVLLSSDRDPAAPIIGYFDYRASGGLERSYHRLYDGFGLDLDSAMLVTRALPLGADPRGVVRGVIAVPAAGSGALRLEGTLDGEAAGSPLALEVSWVGDYLHAGVRLSRLPAAFVKRASGLEIDGDVALAADADGALPQLDFRGEMVAAAARVTAQGYAVVAQGRELAASVEATGVDLARISAGAPQSDLQLRASAFVFEADEGSFVGGHRLEVERGHLARMATPALWLTGKDWLDTAAGVRSLGKLGLSESGVSVRGAYDIALPTRASASVTLSLQAQLEDPERLAALGIRAAGSAALSVRMLPEEHTLNGKASVSLRHVEQAVVQARNVEVEARVSGMLSDPHLVAAATADLLSGRAHADLDYRAAGNQQLDVFATNIDLLRLSRSAGFNIPITQGKLALDAHVQRRSGSGNYRMDGGASADLGKLGAVRVVAKEFELPGASPSSAQVSAMRGELTASGEVRLETLSGLLVQAGVPIERTTGNARFELSAKHQRDDPRGLLLAAQLDTNGLRIVQKRSAAATIATTGDAIEAEPLALEGIDLHLSAHTWPSDGELVGTLIARDPGGTLAELQAELELARIWPHGLLSVAALSGAPLKVTLQVPLRKLRSLPPLLRPAALRGRLALAATLDGSLAEPRVKAEIWAESLRAAGSKQALDLTGVVNYAPSGGDARVIAQVAGATSRSRTCWRPGTVICARRRDSVAGSQALLAARRPSCVSFRSTSCRYFWIAKLVGA